MKKKDTFKNFEFILLILLFVLSLSVTNGFSAPIDQGKASAEGDVVIHEAFPEFAPSELVARQQREPAVPISLGLANTFQTKRNIHQLKTITDEEIAAADLEFEEKLCNISPGPQRVGLVRTVEPVSLAIIGGSAVYTELPDGQKLWTLAIQSPEAYGIRIHFTNFDAGTGSVSVYAQDVDQLIVRGPYTKTGPNRSGDFWTASLPGDTVFIEATGTEEPRFEVAEIGHFDWDPAPAGFEQDDGPPGAAQLPCHLDVMCYDGSSVSAAARQATGKMNFVSGGGISSCTGTLLNDLDGETSVPYFITAYHCLSTQTEVNSLEVIWFWQQDSCGGALPNYSSLPRTVGGTLLETDDTDDGNDMTFIRLTDNLPGGIAFAGWTTARPASGYGIHHPRGDWKRVTFLSDVGTCGGCTFCGDPYDYDYYDIDNGIIEPGSSGSGVFNSSGQLAGQLFGDCCLYVSCAGESLNCGNVDEYVAMYGEFETTYPIIRHWLEIGGTIHVDAANILPPWTGTPSAPFPTVALGYSFAWHGARIKIQAGLYPENLTLSKPVTLVASGGTVTIGQ